MGRSGSRPGWKARVATQASPIVTPDSTIFYASGGKSYVIKAGQSRYCRRHQRTGRWQLRTSPAVAPGMLIIKGTKYLYGIGRK